MRPKRSHRTFSFRSTIQRRRIETLGTGGTEWIYRGSFRSTIQRRRIETQKQKRNNYRSPVFQKYNPEKKDWNWISAIIGDTSVVIFQKYNPEKKDWNGNSVSASVSADPTFRSTIQRRRIETTRKMTLFFVLTDFQKYNPEKKDWNWTQNTPENTNYSPFRSTIQRRRIETIQ